MSLTGLEEFANFRRFSFGDARKVDRVEGGEGGSCWIASAFKRHVVPAIETQSAVTKRGYLYLHLRKTMVSRTRPICVTEKSEKRRASRGSQRSFFKSTLPSR
jgi:hypothetical protein